MRMNKFLRHHINCSKSINLITQRPYKYVTKQCEEKHYKEDVMQFSGVTRVYSEALARTVQHSIALYSTYLLVRGTLLALHVC